MARGSRQGDESPVSTRSRSLSTKGATQRSRSRREIQSSPEKARTSTPKRRGNARKVGAAKGTVVSPEDVNLEQLFSEKEYEDLLLERVPFYRKVSKRMAFFFLCIGMLLGAYIWPFDSPSSEQLQEFMSTIRDVTSGGLSSFSKDFIISSEELLLWSRAFLLESQEFVVEFMDNIKGTLTNDRVIVNLEDELLGAPGKIAAEQKKWKAHFPVLIVPGMLSTGLELWEGCPCGATYFRSRLWGTLNMFRLLLSNRDCWMKHVMLDECSGQDPPGVKLRAADGLEAADYLLPGYWVWGKMIEALAMIGYDPNTLHLAAYDWRLSFEDLQKRDGYFTRLQSKLEMSKRITGKKTVILAHSLGSLLLFYFLNWVQGPETYEDPMRKKSASSPSNFESWVDEHIHAIVTIGAPMLGLPKAMSSLLSGEMKDTAQLGWFESFMMEAFFSQKERAMLLRNWSCVYSMLPTGGDLIWGNNTWAPDTQLFPRNTASDYEAKGTPGRHSNGTAHEETPNVHFGGALLRHPESLGSDEVPWRFNSTITSSSLYQFLIESPLLPESSVYKVQQRQKNDGWINPLKYQLPNAKNLKIYTMYGIGQPSERAYYYTTKREKESEEGESQDRDQDHDRRDKAVAEKGRSIENFVNYCKERGERAHVDRLSFNASYCETPLQFEQDNTRSFGYMVDTSKQIETSSKTLYVHNGVLFSDGDGTVPLISAAYMSAKLWQPLNSTDSANTSAGGASQINSPWNPFGIEVYLREYLHDPIKVLSSKGLDVRGGPKTSEHVDILGNHQLTLDILQIVSNNNNKEEDVATRRVHDPAVQHPRVWANASDPFLGHLIHSDILRIVKDMPIPDPPSFFRAPTKAS